MRVLLIIVFLAALPALAQIPVRPNAYDSDSLKSGNWIEFLDSSLTLCDKGSEQATFYRLSRYDKGSQVGLVETYYLDNQVLRESYTYVGSPPKLHGERYQYSSAGNVTLAYVFDNGQIDKEKSVRLMQEIVRKYEMESPDIEEHGRALRHVGNSYASDGDLLKAEKTFRKGLRIVENIYGEGHEETLGLLSSLALKVYIPMGNYDKALETYFGLLKLMEELAKGKYKDDPLVHVNISVFERGISRCYQLQGDQKKSLVYAQRSFDRIKTYLGEKHTSTLQSAWNLVNALLENHQQSEAIGIAEKSIQNIPQVANQIYHAITHHYLGEAYLANYQDSLSNLHFDKAMELMPKSRPDRIQALRVSFSNAYMLQNREKEANEIRSELLREYEDQLEFLFDNLGELDREKMYNAQKDLFEIQKFTMVEGYKDLPDLLGQVFDYQLNYKGLLLNTSNGIRDRIMRSGDRKLIDLFDEVQLLKQQILSTPSDSLRDMLKTKDERLTQLSTIYKEKSKRHDWKELQSKLGPKEAAVEIVRVRHYDYRFGEFEDIVEYAALIVTSKTKEQPDIVLFKDGNAMENEAAAQYRNSIKFKLEDNASYEIYWKPLEKRLKKYKKIYFSPDGVYHKINVLTLYNNNSSKYLIDEKEVVLMPNLSDLFKESKEPLRNSLGLLVGNPDFSGVKNVTLKSLPATEIEVYNVEKILKSDWNIKSLTGSAATEVALKDMLKPKILHIATHGFFNALADKDLTMMNNPMLNSGLYLARKNGSSEDGILTAHEAMNLNINNTDLVVLSACETGLGEVRNGEGVYGLQRAFQIAGAKSLLMSLWKVDDTATKELMSSFYENLKTTSDKKSSLRSAQDNLRSRYPHPYYWGAFVMLGE